jgi:hypothetical protein
MHQKLPESIQHAVASSGAAIEDSNDCTQKGTCALFALVQVPCLTVIIYFKVIGTAINVTT